MSTLAGTITLPTDTLAPEGATWVVRLEDSSLADAPAKLVAEASGDVDAGASEVPYAVSYPTGSIDAAAVYTIQARIQDASGNLLFVNDTAIPVLTGGAPGDGVVAEVVAASAPLPLATEVAAAASLTP